MLERAVEAVQKPLDLACDVEIALLRLLKTVVVLVPLAADLRRYAVEALSAVFRTRQRHVCDRSGDAAVAVVEGMDGDEPEMGDCRFEDGIDSSVPIEPFQKGAHFWNGSIDRKSTRLNSSHVSES